MPAHRTMTNDHAALPMSADVAALLANLAHPRDAELRAIRAIVLGADARIREEVKWNAPSYCTSEHFATFHLRARDGVQLVLHLGAKPRPDAAVREAIDDPCALLEWRGADRAIARFSDMADVDAKRAALAAIVREWVRHV